LIEFSRIRLRPLGRGAFAPEEVGGESEKKKNDGNGEIAELARIAEGQVDGVANKSSGDKDKEERRPGIAGDAIGNCLALRSAPDWENGSGAKTIENPADKNYPADQFREFSRACKDSRPDPQCDNRGGRSLKARVDFREFLEEEIVIGHSVEHAGSGEYDAIGRAKGRDQDGEGDKDRGAATEDCGNGSSADGVTRGGGGRPEGDQVGKNRGEIEGRKDQRAEKKRLREVFLRVDYFRGTVRAELPAFVSPENGHHG
jgi:hypothetical protein